jgi:hypothetical protein
LFFALSLALLFASSQARARAEDGAQAIFERAEREDARGAYDEALVDYARVVAADPSSRVAPQADARAEVLRTHAEGAFEPLRRLERVRRDPALASDREAIDALVRDAEGFPPGLVRVEAWELAAEAYARRLGRPGDAVLLWRRIVSDPAADPATARLAAREAVRVLGERGDLDAAEAVARDAAPVDPALSRDVARLVRRHRLHLASVGVVACMGALAAAAWAAAVRERRASAVAAAARRSAPLALGYAAYVGVAGAILASSYEPGSARPFLLFGVALGPTLLVARAWAAAGRRTPAARSLRAALCGAAAVAAAFLVLESVDARYLEGFGL